VTRTLAAVTSLALFCAALLCEAPAAQRAAAPAHQAPPVTLSKAFEGGSLGKVEKLGETVFRCFVEGQHDERGRNRQANWYYFRMDGVKDRDMTITLTDFLGEYNDQPGACSMNADTIPVYSDDGERWQHFPAMDWNDATKEATLKFRPANNAIWIAHVPPYTHSRLLGLLEQINQSPQALVEVIGKTVQGRDLHLVTVTNFEKPEEGKQTVWLQARQHAWEAGTSYVMEGALRFVTSRDPRAAKLRDQVVFKFTPMMDPDGCAQGRVRFNANGYDVNRHWDGMDLRRKELLERMPEIWYVKKAILGWVDSGRRIDLMINLHNTETSEFLETQADDETTLKMMQGLLEDLASKSGFDPSDKLRISAQPGSTTNSLYVERKIPVLLMEQRVGTSNKLGRRPNVQDRLDFGKQLIAVMAEKVLQ